MEAPYIQKAIQRAVAAGWSGPVWLNPGTQTQERGSLGSFNELGNATTQWEYEYYLLDREFWQYLAKAQSWKGSEVESAESAKLAVQSVGLHYWHRFIRHVARGKDAESFVRSILTQVEKPEHGCLDSTGSTDPTRAN
jgi:hypothetical protein